jgi:hypothetical protein
MVWWFAWPLMDRLIHHAEEPTTTTGGTQRCDNCGSHVSDAFTRVFGDNDGRLHQCLSCSTTRELEQGPY